MELRKCDQPEIAENHGVKIKSQDVAEAESAEREKNRDQREGRNIQRGRVRPAFVEHGDMEICIDFRDVDQRQATCHDVKIQKEGGSGPDARLQGPEIRNVRQVGHARSARKTVH